MRRFVVHLPTSKRTTPITSTAYAFNEDRVKSATAEDKSYFIPAGIVERQPRAYVISIDITATMPLGDL